MSASILDGKYVASILQNSMKQQLMAHMQTSVRQPGLAVILVGDDSASQIYVNHKRKACENIGFKSFAYNLAFNTTEKELLFLLDKLNNQEDVDGILVQLPLPVHINPSVIMAAINPSKDVDGFNPINFGKLAQGTPFLRPCTSLGVINLLKFYEISLVGKNVVVIGASNIVGRPMALEFLLARSTVTICHKATQNLKTHVQNADIVVSATGTKNIISPSWLHQNHIVIDVGIHREPSGAISGDIDFDEAKKRVAWITPVPGGVGPMTICMLLHNTLLAANIPSMHE